ncbi:hypothetical protein FRACYDRAFT_235126 [Fragilariopsis cylindrus CCMP1102]|uniref:N-acetyltransferase domain-containing protein n=1 Tax=Fragilariopsis cylindrus CCMP1102 TaxID=635003 RepID=A0A1E7FTJ9_9STRA|nr:hypothetical protein FRACYDRAFT_235126 [Fragilariopsis cylindrus CCMP1102]|eukprot:OEU21500.1 hypothetical protein FRACYDRAFT_235126 [Fragilariopsis cylindrus CCMP1102]
MKSQRRRDDNGVLRQQRQRQKNNHDRRRMNSITPSTTNGNNRGIRLSRSCCCHRGKLGLAMHIVAAFTAVTSTCSRNGVVKALSTTTNKSTSATLLRATCSNDLPLTVAAVTNGRRRQRQQHLSRSRTTRLNLFFNQRDENGNMIKSSQKSRGRGKRGKADRQPFITSETLEELRSSPGITFPREVRLFNDDDAAVEDYDGDDSDDYNDNEDNRKSLLLRFMTTDDLKSLVPMCVEEFGNHGSNTQQQQVQLQQQTSNMLRMIPWYNNNTPQKSIPDLWDGFCFEQLISWTLRLKLMQGNNNTDNNNIDLSSSENNNASIKKKMIINDPVMLVLCERRQRRQQKNQRHPQQHPATTSTTDNNDDDSSTPATTMMMTTTTKEEAVAVGNNDKHEERIVGMVELSLQPPNADRNPPALPLPKWIKSELASLTQLGSLQGWVTNLLIDSSCRGLGYSKVLMAATEGIAKQSWDCNYLFLHADADVTSGKIPQSLYNNLGYDLVKGSTLNSEGSGNGNEQQQQQQQQKLSLEDEFAWAAAAGQNLERCAAIRMVDDVALLCFSKKL